MLDRIKQLESLARKLEPTPQLRASARKKVVQYAEDFLNHLPDMHTYVTTQNSGIGLYDSPITEQPINIDKALRLLKHNVDMPGLNPASGGHLGYIPGGGVYYSALGDYLADVTNRFAGLYFAGPGAVRMENLLLQWMMKIIGYPTTACGNLTSGGSVANLIGIVAARDAHRLKAKKIPKSVIYLTQQAHHSVDKAIRIAGLKECILRYVPMDKHFRMNANALEQQIVKDKKSKLHPWLVIAAAGTTDVGAVDPLEAIGMIAKKHNLWFHLDAAYGGFFVLCKEGKKALKGMEHSDSISIDPHKGLFLPYGTGAVLVKDKKKLYDAFWYKASYLQDALRIADDLSPADLSPELTKHFRGLRMWLPLKLYGLAPFRAALEEKILLARYFYNTVKQTEGFEVGQYPDLSVVTFRYIPKRGNVNKFNERLVQEVQRDGRVFLSATTLNGTYIIRLAVLCFRTHKDTIDLAIKILKESVRRLEKKL